MCLFHRLTFLPLSAIIKLEFLRQRMESCSESSAQTGRSQVKCEASAPEPGALACHAPFGAEFASLEQTRPGIPFTYTGCQIERDLIAADVRTSEEAAAKLWLLYHRSS
jgi:hypothetical protein